MMCCQPIALTPHPMPVTPYFYFTPAHSSSLSSPGVLPTKVRLAPEDRPRGSFSTAVWTGSGWQGAGMGAGMGVGMGAGMVAGQDTYRSARKGTRRPPGEDHPLDFEPPSPESGSEKKRAFKPRSPTPLLEESLYGAIA